MKLLIAVLVCSFFCSNLNMKPDLPPAAVLYVFEGSDWCNNCARLEKKILTDSIFQKQISTLEIELERIDFPQRKKLPSELMEYNQKIAEKFGFDGVFPTLIIARTDTEHYLRIYYQNESVEDMLIMITNNLDILYERVPD